MINKSIILRQFKKYPLMGSIDFFKLVYHDCYLTGHMLGDNAFEYLLHESENIKNRDCEKQKEIYEYISEDVTRINLYPFKQYYSLESLFEMFKNSSLIKQKKDFGQEINTLFTLKLVNKSMINGYYLKTLDEGFIPSHSKIYKDNYKPAYRVVHSDLISVELKAKKLELFIDSLDHNKRNIICLEGKCGSGKSSICEQIKNATIIHVDDFFSQVKDEPINIKALKEVLEKIKKGIDTIVYKKYDCKNSDYIDVQINLTNVVIIEGVFGYIENFRSYYDYLGYVVMNENKQIERLELRENKETMKRFVEEWIPRENEYYKTYDFLLNADILL